MQTGRMGVLDQASDELKTAYRHECRERLLRAAVIVENHSVLSGSDLDLIHQEFDTLYGAARAMHLPDLEIFFRTVACFARFLRNNSSPDVELRRELLQQGIKMGMQCSEIHEPYAEGCAGELSQWLTTVENILGGMADI